MTTKATEAAELELSRVLADFHYTMPIDGMDRVVSAYLKALSPVETGELAERLRNPTGDEKLDDDCACEAADALTSLAADNARLRALVAVKDEALTAADELEAAGHLVLAGLNARIDAAPSTSVPVFNGIADLHDALGHFLRARSAQAEGGADENR